MTGPSSSAAMDNQNTLVTPPSLQFNVAPAEQPKTTAPPENDRVVPRVAMVRHMDNEVQSGVVSDQDVVSTFSHDENKEGGTVLRSLAGEITTLIDDLVPRGFKSFSVAEGHSGGGAESCPFSALLGARQQTLRSQTMRRTRPQGHSTSRKSMYHGSMATSVTKGLSDIFGTAKALHDLGLGELERDEWTQQELARRQVLVPILKQTLHQLDGTIPSTLPATQGHGITQFGDQYFKDLFRKNPEMHYLFGHKPVEQLSLSVMNMIRELLMLEEMESPRHLAGAVAELALMHIEYGVRNTHAEPFKVSLLRTMRKVVQARGFRWSRNTQVAWKSSLDETVGLLMEAVSSGRPRVEMLQRSWREMCTAMSEKKLNRTKNTGSVASSTRPVRPGLNAKYTRSIELGASKKFPPSASKQNLTSHESGERESEATGFAAGRWMSRKTGRRSSVWPEDTDAARQDLHGQVFQPQMGFLDSLMPNWMLGGASIQGQKQRSLNNSPEPSYWVEASASAVQSFGMADPTYIRGKEIMGQEFIHIFGSRNEWIVEKWRYGINNEMAYKMGEMLETIVRCATRPEFLHHEMRVLALKHSQMGVKSEMFDDFEDALFVLLEQVLTSINMWNDDMKETWLWLWGIVRRVFCRHMENTDTMLEKLDTSWDMIQDRRDEITSGFYTQLFRMSPHLESLFTKPEAMQHIMLQKALDVLVRAIHDPAVLQVEVKAIAIRHIKYDISRDDFKVFGDVLINTLRDAAGPLHWDDETGQAWADIYEHTTQAFRQVLSSGKNLVCQALLSGSASDLCKALDVTSRGRRTQSALEIQIDDRIMSPITWSVVEGHPHLTEILLQDVLAIRSDRLCYYYGREELWRACPWLMPLLVEKAPKILPVLLDGHLWCSRFVELGGRRVNYYIKELYGNPHVPEHSVVYKSPLAILVHKLPMSELHIFSHPVMTFLVNLKWRMFARRWFIQSQILNVTNLVSNTLFLHYGRENSVASFSLGLVTVSLAMLRLFIHMGVIAHQIKTSSGTHIRSFRILMPYALLDWYVVLNIGSAVMCAVLFCFTFVADPFMWKDLLAGNELDRRPEVFLITEDNQYQIQAWATIAAFTTFMLWIEATEVFKMSTKLSALSYALTAVLSEVMRYMAFMALWVLGFGMTMYWLFVAKNVTPGGDSSPTDLHNPLKLDQELISDHLTGTLEPISFLYVLLLTSLGYADTELVITSSWMVRIVFLMCVFATSVVLLNLLVAAMVTAYDHLQTQSGDLAMTCRAEIVLRAEDTMSLKRRISIFDSLGFDESCEFDIGDKGPSGGIQVRERMEDLDHPSFKLLDRVQRFSGTTAADAPWDPSKCHTAHRHHQARTDAGMATTLESLENAINTQMAYVQQEFLRMRNGASTIHDTISFGGGSVQDAGHDTDNGFADNVSGKHDKHTHPLQTRLGALSECSHDDQGIHDSEQHSDGNRGITITHPDGEASNGTVPRAVSMSELSNHNSETSLWVAINGMVYDITSLLAYHPGGRKLLLSTGGTDVTKLFLDTHVGPSRTAASGLLRSMTKIGVFRQQN